MKSLVVETSQQWRKNARDLAEPAVRLALPSASIREASSGSEQWLRQKLTAGQNAETVECSALTRTSRSSPLRFREHCRRGDRTNVRPRRWRSTVTWCLLDTTWLLHTWPHIISGYPHKTGPTDIPLWAGRVHTAPLLPEEQYIVKGW